MRVLVERAPPVAGRLDCYWFSERAFDILRLPLKAFLGLMLPYPLSQTLNFHASCVHMFSSFRFFRRKSQSRQIPFQNIMNISTSALLLVVTAIAGNKAVRTSTFRFKQFPFLIVEHFSYALLKFGISYFFLLCDDRRSFLKPALALSRHALPLLQTAFTRVSHLSVLTQNAAKRPFAKMDAVKIFA